MSTSASSTPPASGADIPPLRELIVRYKFASLCAAGVIAIVLAMVLFAVFGAKAGAVTDSTTCTQWGSANVNRQNAYAQLYVNEHGPLKGGVTDAQSVINAINDGCEEAYGDDVSDNTTIIQAIDGTF
jgi:hypothetical protein